MQHTSKKAQQERLWWVGGLVVVLTTWLMLGLGAIGCELLDDALDDFSDGFDECQTSQGPSTVGGRWSIVGSGSRSGCVDDQFDGDFQLTSGQITVVQRDDPQNSSVDILEIEPIEIPGGQFTMVGSVRGTCVDFTMDENGHTGTFHFTFDGALESGVVTGDFTAEGPPGCASTGTFRINRQ